MKTTKQLQAWVAVGLSPWAALAQLEATRAIKAKVCEKEGLVLLDYDLIKSPKLDELVLECRSLILSFPEFKVVSRKFDRFFNYGECQDYYKDFDFNDCTVYEKADGSLIGIYFYNEKWNISTRGNAFADQLHWSGVSFKDKVLQAFGYKYEGEFEADFDGLSIDYTYIFEYTSPENRIVTPYNETSMVFLGAVNNLDGSYIKPHDSGLMDLFKERFRLPTIYKHLSTPKNIETKAEQLPDLKEGFVIVDNKTGKRIKVKSTKYVIAHGLSGADPVPSDENLLKLLVTGELDEFMAYFPTFKEQATRITNRYESIMDNLRSFNRAVQDDTLSQKEFAALVKDVPCNALLFQARKEGVSILDVIYYYPKDKLIRLLMKYL